MTMVIFRLSEDSGTGKLTGAAGATKTKDDKKCCGGGRKMVVVRFREMGGGGGAAGRTNSCRSRVVGDMVIQ